MIYYCRLGEKPYQYVSHFLSTGEGYTLTENIEEAYIAYAGNTIEEVVKKFPELQVISLATISGISLQNELSGNGMLSDLDAEGI